MYLMFNAFNSCKEILIQSQYQSNANTKLIHIYYSIILAFNDNNHIIHIDVIITI